MKHVTIGLCSLTQMLAVCLGTLLAQAPEVIEDESKVPDYSLPDPLLGKDGQPIKDAAVWTDARRQEILELFREQMYGRSPGRPADQSFEQVDCDEQALQGTTSRGGALAGHVVRTV